MHVHERKQIRNDGLHLDYRLNNTQHRWGVSNWAGAGTRPRLGTQLIGSV